jgi:hypothetical protein
MTRIMTYAALMCLALSGLLVFSNSMNARSGTAVPDACDLLKVSDVTPLLGGTPVSQGSPGGQVCTWKGADPKRKLMVITYRAEGPGAEAAFGGARHGAQADAEAKVSDETGIGDQAFSAQVSFGAIFVVLKKGRLLQLQYWTGDRGTSQDLEALRPVAMKAVAAF